MPNTKKPALEKVSTEFGSSFSVKHYSDPSPLEKPPFWHFHPEIELVYVKGGSGKRHIGNHLSYYQNGDLVLIGSMLPHTGFTDRLTGNESESIIQFNYDCFGQDFFESKEMQDIKKLLTRAKAGIAFNGQAKRRIGAQMRKLSTAKPFEKFIGLISILQDMANTEDYKILNADGYTIEFQSADNTRINDIYTYVQQHFQKAISLEQIAGVANMTVPAFCRYFKKISGKTFTRFANEIRVVHSCKLLSEKQLSIAEVSFESGFNNLSHFNRLFKEITHKSPSEYRKEITQLLHDEE